MDSSKTQPTVLSPEVVEMIADHTERGAKKALRNYSRTALVGFLVLLLGVLLALSKTADTNELRAGLMSSCRRVNILRAQSNNSDLVSFRILTISAQRERQLARLSGGRAHSVHETSASLLEMEARQLTITGLTDCGRAVDHAKEYRFPVANPVGNARTGVVSTRAARISDDSHKLLERYYKVQF